MIRIDICPAHGGSGGYYTAFGHAGEGNELVCNAVSVIEELMAVNILKTWNVRVRRTISDGAYTLRWNRSDRKGEGLRRANQAAGFAYNGLKELEKTYPDILKVNWKRPDDYGRDRL